MSTLPRMNTPHGMLLQLGRRSHRRGRGGRRGGRGRGRRGRGTPRQAPKRARDSTPGPTPMADIPAGDSHINGLCRTQPPIANPMQRNPPGGRKPPDTHHPPKRAHYLDVDECQQQQPQEDERRFTRDERQSVAMSSDEDDMIYTNDANDPDAAAPWNARTHYRQRSNAEIASSTATGMNQYVSPIARSVPLSPPPRWTEDGPDPRGFRGDTTTYGTRYVRPRYIPASSADVMAIVDTQDESMATRRLMRNNHAARSNVPTTEAQRPSDRDELGGADTAEHSDALQWRHMDLTTSTDTYVVHQTNCISTTAQGLARQMFHVFAHADCYAARRSHSMPGTITVRGNGHERRLVVNMHAQIAPGGPRRSGQDTREMRERYFMQCLQQLEQHMRRLYHGRSVRVAFPQRIGCGLAGGHWPTYRNMIQDFARIIRITHNPEDVVTICCLREEGLPGRSRDGVATTDAANQVMTKRERPPRLNVRTLVRALVAAHATCHERMGVSVRGTNAETFTIAMMMWIMAAIPNEYEKRHD